MPNNNSQPSLNESAIPKPYSSVGAGRLTAFIWKLGDQTCGWRYRFNVVRISRRNGRSTQLFAPGDLRHFVKLTQVLAAVLADDGCLPPAQRREIAQLEHQLDAITRTDSTAQAAPVPDDVLLAIRALLDRELPLLASVPDAESRLAQHVVVRQWLFAEETKSHSSPRNES